MDSLFITLAIWNLQDACLQTDNVIFDQSIELLLLVELLTLCPAELNAMPAWFRFVGQSPCKGGGFNIPILQIRKLRV